MELHDTQTHATAYPTEVSLITLWNYTTLKRHGKGPGTSQRFDYPMDLHASSNKDFPKSSALSDCATALRFPLGRRFSLCRKYNIFITKLQYIVYIKNPFRNGMGFLCNRIPRKLFSQSFPVGDEFCDFGIERCGVVRLF